MPALYGIGEPATFHAYYVPGRHDELASGPGRLLTEAGLSVAGRTLPGDLSGLGFDDQIGVVRDDLRRWFWQDEALTIGRSYGAYLVMHALSQMPAYPGRVVLFSPVLGAAHAEASGRFYGAIPPRDGELQGLTRTQRFPAPRCLEIVIGQHDIGCSASTAGELAESLNGVLRVVPSAGHELPREVYSEVLLGSS